MAELNLDIEDSKARWIEERVQSGAYDSPAALIEALLERDRQEAAELELLRQAIEKGRASGISTRTLDEIFADIAAERNAA